MFAKEMHMHVIVMLMIMAMTNLIAHSVATVLDDMYEMVFLE